MWPFREKTVQMEDGGEVHLPTFIKEVERRWGNYSECSKCHHLINKAFIKVVEHRIGGLGSTRAQYCLECAPEWDLLVDSLRGYPRRYYKRIPAVPEAFEEVNLPAEAPQPTQENVNTVGYDGGATLESTFEETAKAHADAGRRGVAKARREIAARKKRREEEETEALAAMLRAGRAAAKKPMKARPRAKKPTK